MAIYNVEVPPTMDQGNFKFVCNDNANTRGHETYQQNALWQYNINRDHDGQEPLKRMPNGITYTRMYEYEIHGDYGYGYGFECVTTEESRAAALEQITCYRINEPGVPFKIVKVGL